MEETKEKRIKRFTIWGAFLVVVGLFASIFAPEHSIAPFFTLLKDIIVNLIIGA